MDFKLDYLGSSVSETWFSKRYSWTVTKILKRDKESVTHEYKGEADTFVEAATEAQGKITEILEREKTNGRTGNET